MKKNTWIRKFLLLALALAIVVLGMAGCEKHATQTSGSISDRRSTKEVADKLSNNQPTPTDIDFSLERYNLMRRAYWVNGNRERANVLPCSVQKPLGYVVLFSGNAVVGRFVVDGKVSSLNSYLTPDSDYYEIATGATTTYRNHWLAGVDGSYGENDSGIFFFTPDGKYIEWTGTYLYSDIPFEVQNTVLTYREEK